MQVHLDTDFGGDPDDACALAFLLGTPAVQITGITTNLDFEGYRAGCVHRYLELAGVEHIPVASGAGTSFHDLKRYDSTARDSRYWPRPVEPRLSEPGAALNLLHNSIEKGATIIAIGAATNVLTVEVLRPGTLAHARIVFMGGWFDPPERGYPPWGPEMDWNTQCDPEASGVLELAGELTLVALPPTLKASLRGAHLARLRACGPVGELLALQSEVHARARGMTELAREHDALPSDLVNFHYDPVTAATAIGWSGVTLERRRIRSVMRAGLRRFEENDAGRWVNIVTDVDGASFSELWLSTVEHIDARSR
jgi:purine nucleosidase